MTIYFIILFFIIFIGLNIRKERQSFIISFLLFLTLCLRKKTVGIDLLAYLNIFKDVARFNFKELLTYDMEKGYIFFNKLLSIFTTNERIFIIIYSFFLMIFIKKYIDKYSKIKWLSYFLFITLSYYGMTFNIIRQFFAMSILLLSLEDIKKRNLKKFIFYYLISISFHYTAIFFILLYIIYPLKIDIKYLFYLLIGITFNFLFLSQIIEILLNIIPKYSIRYADIIKKGEGEKLLIMLLFVFIIAFILKKGSIKEGEIKIFYHMMGIAVYLQSFALGFSLFTRIVNYFSISMIILIPNLVFNQKNKKIKSLGIFLIILLTMIYYRISLNQNLSKIVPYQFFWQ